MTTAFHTHHTPFVRKRFQATTNRNTPYSLHEHAHARLRSLGNRTLLTMVGHDTGPATAPVMPEESAIPPDGLMPEEEDLMPETVEDEEAAIRETVGEETVYEPEPGEEEVGEPEPDIIMPEADELEDGTMASEEAAPIAAEETEEDWFMPAFPEIFGEGRFTYSYGGRRAMTGAFARWQATTITVRPRVFRRRGTWRVRLVRCRMRARYWLNRNATWNHIRNFPGGAYRSTFNTPRGSRTHERAELRAVGRLWRAMQRRIRAGLRRRIFPTRALARQHWRTVYAREWAAFRTPQLAISNHSNPVGPTAEWNFYRRAHRRFLRSRRRRRRGRRRP